MLGKSHPSKIALFVKDVLSNFDTIVLCALGLISVWVVLCPSTLNMGAVNEYLVSCLIAPRCLLLFYRTPLKSDLWVEVLIFSLL